MKRGGNQWQIFPHGQLAAVVESSNKYPLIIMQRDLFILLKATQYFIVTPKNMKNVEWHVVF